MRTTRPSCARIFDLPCAVFLALLSVWMAIPDPAFAQQPRPSTPQRLLDSTDSLGIKRWLAASRFTGTVTVDPGGRGDYADLGDALTYVTAQTRSQALRWLVLVYPGQQTGATGANLTEASVTIPSWTSIQGVVGINAQGSLYAPTVRVSGTSGNLVAFGQGASVEDVTFLMSANVTAAALRAPTSSRSCTRSLAADLTIPERATSASGERAETGLHKSLR